MDKFIKGHLNATRQKRYEFVKTFGLKEIRGWGPCYDPNKYVSEDWQGTVVDILKLDKVPFEDKLWVVLRTGLVSERTIRLFAVWSARQAQKYVREDEHKKFSDILDVIHRFAMGEVTEQERDAAWERR